MCARVRVIRKIREDNRTFARKMLGGKRARNFTLLYLRVINAFVYAARKRRLRRLLLREIKGRYVCKFILADILA